MLNHKYDFVGVICVKNANPNGDPLNGNRPRINYNGIGEISDVCLKRKIRNRLLDAGEQIFVQSEDYKVDTFTSLRDRAEGILSKEAFSDKERLREEACGTWIDVRAFGQLFAFKSKDKKTAGVSEGIRGPVSIHSAYSVDPINISTIQITKSVNSEGDGTTRGSDTMGSKHRVDFGVYTFAGSINAQLASRTGFTDEDAEKIKQAIYKMFENDASSARPDGSMQMVKLFWWKHNNPSGQYSSAKVHQCVKIERINGVMEPVSMDDYEVKLTNLDGLEVEIIEGF
ncbi:type I-C CRISPR-associated protein Cas7/Csd2 [Proteiniclasticum sp. BAD-10]|uniref:Type I-C CRISPR-associated protein Cas7/Csd2 n=1 Tax=Proteiniclasticum sediminis TaxID=2804028 RepID=A0A941HR78_9CLOT|nr:type I-C CRISPR-associated protein Cas7/Csd2 [Proteiniclasticum sediminis]MBR0577136.1 type I-C CRISPR-associated protein Cas7/Csd2 [Proteiniclasticum sediminis]